jgi:hypothetical protein
MLQADKHGIQRNLAKHYINGWIELMLIDELFSISFSEPKQIMIWIALDECRTWGKVVMQRASGCAI